MTSPPAIANDSSVGHCVDGAPETISRVKKFWFSPITIGVRPSAVGTDVKSTGHRPCASGFLAVICKLTGLPAPGLCAVKLTLGDGTVLRGVVDLKTRRKVTQ